MFEFIIAAKYLIPRWRSFYTSCIALISVAVIALVAWLVLVFLSVQTGIQKQWVEKLVAVNAPLQIRPTDAYYNSYYYRIDRISEASYDSYKSIDEKLHAERTDPHQDTDQSVPDSWPAPLLDKDGKQVDLVKEVFALAEQNKGTIAGLRLKPFEVGMGNLRLTLIRSSNAGLSSTILSQASYMSGFDPANTRLGKTISPLTTQDFCNILTSLPLADTSGKDEPGYKPQDESVFRDLLKRFFSTVTLDEITVGPLGTRLDDSILPEAATWTVLKVRRPDGVRAFVPASASDLDDAKRALDSLHLEYEVASATWKDGYQASKVLLGQGEGRLEFYLLPAQQLAVSLEHSSIDTATALTDLHLQLKSSLQGSRLNGPLPYFNCKGSAWTPLTTQAKDPALSPLWITADDDHFNLPLPQEGSQGILLADSLRKNDVCVGDRGYIAYYAPSPSGIREQRASVFVAGFYNPGIMPVGRFLLADPSLVSAVRSSLSQQDQRSQTGISVWLDDLDQVDVAKSLITSELQKRGLDSYWTVESYKDYEFSKPFIQQLSSDLQLLSLIAIIIILVACSNIISMIILLVNDKRKEIGILRAMGASQASIALIFGSCGFAIGLLGSLIGMLAAWATLRHLDLLVQLLSSLQGHQAFNAAFYGSSLPNEISVSAFWAVCIGTVVLSVIAGLIPAIKACSIKPSQILKSE